MNRYGLLRDRVQVVTEKREPSGTSGAAPTRTEIARPWAKIQTLKGSERVGTVVQGEGPTHRFVIRHDAAIEAEMRVIFDGRKFRILDVENVDERSVWADLLVREERA